MAAIDPVTGAGPRGLSSLANVPALALEARFMFDAAGAATGAEVAQDSAAEVEGASFAASQGKNGQGHGGQEDSFAEAFSTHSPPGNSGDDLDGDGASAPPATSSPSGDDDAAPILSNLDGDSVAFPADGESALLDAEGDAAIIGDNVDLRGGSLTVSIVEGGSATDVLEIMPSEGIELIGGGNALQVSVSDADGDKKVIGHIRLADGSGGQDLRIDFDSSIHVTAERVETLIRALAYRNGGDTAGDAKRTVRITLIDGSETSTADVTVGLPPTAVDDVATTDEDSPLEVSAGDGVLANDLNLDAGDGLTLVGVDGKDGTFIGEQITLASGALLTLNADGSYSYDPNGAFDHLGAGEVGTDSFSYTVRDNAGNTSTATVTLTITGVNDAPLAESDGGYSTAEDTPLTIPAADLLANDTDRDGNAPSLVSVGDASGGTVALDANGDVVFAPDVDYNGPASFSYTVADASGATSTATVALTVTPVADLPTVAVSGGGTAFIEDGGPVAVTPQLTLADRDGTVPTSATVRIAGNYQAGADVLSLATNSGTMGDITASFDVGTGTLRLASEGGSATIAQWQAALRAVAYNNVSDDPVTAARAIQIRLGDGQTRGAAVTTTVSVTAVADAIVTSPSSQTFARTPSFLGADGPGNPEPSPEAGRLLTADSDGAGPSLMGRLGSQSVIESAEAPVSASLGQYQASAVEIAPDFGAAGIGDGTGADALSAALRQLDAADIGANAIGTAATTAAQPGSGPSLAEPSAAESSADEPAEPADIDLLEESLEEDLEAGDSPLPEPDGEAPEAPSEAALEGGFAAQLQAAANASPAAGERLSAALAQHNPPAT